MTAEAARRRVAGDVTVPGDKSISHRAVLFAALATGRSRIRGILQSADIESSAALMRALGVSLPSLAPDITIDGRGLRGLRAPAGALDCGNSGTTARLGLGMLAAQPFTARLVGDASLSRRPMRRLAEPLRAMGARVEFEGAHDGLPLTVQGGALREVAWTSPVASAQIKSAVLLAGLCAGVPVTLREPQQSRDHSERLLASLGVPLLVQHNADGTVQVRLAPVPDLDPLDLAVPGDPSSAAYFAALAAMSGDGELRLRNVALNPTRLGAFSVLRRMGASVRLEPGAEQGELIGDIVVHGTQELRAADVAASEIPSLIDEIPMLACVAACARGDSTITGAAELRVKESDRIAAVVANLRALGVQAEELPDGLRVRGNPSARLAITGSPWPSGR
jgi:3-phosphoshikimate 1-carboxyvinyltransferase